MFECWAVDVAKVLLQCTECGHSAPLKEFSLELNGVDSILNHGEISSRWQIQTLCPSCEEVGNIGGIRF